MNDTPPFLRFDFPGDAPRIFRNPRRLIVATDVAQVRPALRRVEQATREGFWAAGYVAYEAAPAFDAALTVQANFGNPPLVWFGIYDRAEAPPDAPDGEPDTANDLFGDWTADFTFAEYARGVAEIRAAIAAGETYQVNFTMRRRAPFAGDAATLYTRLRGAQPGAFGALLQIGRWQIVSLSPELFFTRQNACITVRPMKGTAARGRWPDEDQQNRARLAVSEKNRAENIMIVDLLRSDLGRIAIPGSVQAESLFAVETHPTVHQMTSTVTATLRADTSLDDIFTALFPCGSVTGAPKVQTMRHIAARERAPRHVYCGAIGIVSPGGHKPGGDNATFSVAIRTLLLDCETKTAHYGVGSGIVWDSTAEDEWNELQTKCALLSQSPLPRNFALLETLRLDNGVYFLDARHVQRLRASAHYFGWTLQPEKVEQTLRQVARRYPTGLWRVRLTQCKNGASQTEISPLVSSDPLLPPPPVALVHEPVDERSVFLFHKTTHRVAYEQARANLPQNLYAVLLWNRSGEITEFDRGNIALRIGGTLWTPPLHCGLLAGTLRGEMLARGALAERVLTRDDLLNADEILFLNSVRGVVPVRLVTG